MLDSEIHIGDVLRIRSFEDMKSEFGADKDGDILMDDGVYFFEQMGYMCGKLFTVSDIEDDGGYEYEYRSFQGVEESDNHHWCIKAWMLEPYTDTEEFYIASDEEISSLLS